MNKLSTDKRASMLSALVEGCSVASTCRMLNVSKMTVLKLLCDVGEACDDLQDRWFRGLDCKRLQIDEIWSFVGMKAKNVPADKRGTFGYGDVWTFVAIDADTKLVPCWRLGHRNEMTADEFMMDLSSRVRGHVQITTDGLAAYVPAVNGAFRDRADYAMLVKNYNEAPKDERRRYSPSKFVSAELKNIFGEPDPEHVSTSYIERQNLNIRMTNRRMTRLTNAFSKKLVNHARQLAINFAHHNFVRLHETIRCTPAMAAGITSEVWSIADLIRVTDEYEMTRSWPLAHVA